MGSHKVYMCSTNEIKHTMKPSRLHGVFYLICIYVYMYEIKHTMKPSRLHGVFYLICTTHGNFMGSHIVRAVIVPDLYYKLA